MLLPTPLVIAAAFAATLTTAVAQPALLEPDRNIYEKPAPARTVEAAAQPAPVAAVRSLHKTGPRERASTVRGKAGAVVAAAREAKPSPGPAVVAAQTPAATSGPIESAAPSLRDLVAKHARANGVPEPIATAVIDIESRFNPRARGGSALGLMQIKYETARSMGYAGAAAGLFLPENNLQFGMKVLGEAYKQSHGDLCMTLARYQSGHRVTHASAANRAYCTRARSLMARA